MYPQPMNEAGAIHITACAIVAIGHLHTQNVLFRGLCHETLPFTPEGLLQLTDFR